MDNKFWWKLYPFSNIIIKTKKNSNFFDFKDFKNLHNEK